MPQKQTLNKLAVYIPQSKRTADIGKRLLKLAKKKDRSINHLVVEAILDYLDREERRKQ